MRRVFLVFLLSSSVWAAPVDDQMKRGLEALQAMDVVAAMTAFDAALALEPTHAEAAYHRGRILMKIGEPGKAVADFTTAILSKPDFGRALARRGEAKIALKDWVNAFQDFDEAVRLSPQDYEVFVVRATYRFKRAELAGAVADMESAIAVADEATAVQLRKMLERMK